MMHAWKQGTWHEAHFCRRMLGPGTCTKKTIHVDGLLQCYFLHIDKLQNDMRIKYSGGVSHTDIC